MGQNRYLFEPKLHFCIRFRSRNKFTAWPRKQFFHFMSFHTSISFNALFYLREKFQLLLNTWSYFFFTGALCGRVYQRGLIKVSFYIISCFHEPFSFLFGVVVNFIINNFLPFFFFSFLNQSNKNLTWA